MMTQAQHFTDTGESAKRELYHLIAEGYEAMQEGKVSAIDEVKKNIEKRRQQLD